MIVKRISPGFAALWATPGRRGLVAGLVAMIVTAATASHHEVSNNYALLAFSFVHGHIDISWPGVWIDALSYNGKYYVIEGPLPALLLVPWVALVGGADQSALAIFLCGVAVGLAWLTCERSGASPRSALWLCAFFYFGTQLWWCARLGGDVWFLAHVTGVAFTIGALAETAGHRRGWVVALAICAATFARFSLVLAVPVFVWLVVRDRTPIARMRALGGFAAVCVIAGVTWVAYNEARWNLWYDIGFTEWFRRDPIGVPNGSPFAVRYLGYELWSFFVQGPQLQAAFPYLIFVTSGVAMTWTSPALALAFSARRPNFMVIAMWVATILTAGPSFVYYVNGFAQFGMRHALDFEPFLLVLMALGSTSGIPRWGRALIVWSVLVGIWGVWLTIIIYHH